MPLCALTFGKRLFIFLPRNDLSRKADRGRIGADAAFVRSWEASQITRCESVLGYAGRTFLLGSLLVV